MAKLNLPFDGRVYLSSPFGWRTLNGVRDYHKGVDLVGQDNITIRAPCDGVIGQSTMIPQYLTDVEGNQYTNPNNTWQWGNYVRLDTPDGLYIFMCHMSERLVTVGQKVTRGQALGVMGNTGYSFGAHTHFEVRNARGESLDPTPYLGIENTAGFYKNEEEKIMGDEKKTTAELPESEWSKKEGWWAKATERGIVDGTNPRGNLTREQFIAVLGRLGLI